jgi:transcriptional regulator with XRE-family HTH domain
MKNRSADIDALIGSNLRSIRSQKGLTQENLAERLGLTFQQIQKYERGINRISCSTLYLISKKLDVPLLSFFNGLYPNTEPQQTFNNPAEFEIIDLFRSLQPDTRRTLKSILQTLSR